MKKLSMLGLLAGTTLLCAFPGSLQLSQDKLSVSLDTASARVGRPLTPVSVAGVARRTERRAYRRGAVAAGAAIGAAPTTALPPIWPGPDNSVVDHGWCLPGAVAPTTQAEAITRAMTPTRR